MVADIPPSTDEESIHLDPDVSSRTEDRINLRASDSRPRTAKRIHLDPDVSSRTEDSIQLDPAEVKKHFDRIGHFRILVIGRSNAGKTTLLQRVCNTTELPDIFNIKGEKVECHILPYHSTYLQVTDMWQLAD